jgi:hypothetical protein
MTSCARAFGPDERRHALGCTLPSSFRRWAIMVRPRKLTRRPRPDPERIDLRAASAAELEAAGRVGKAKGSIVAGRASAGERYDAFSPRAVPGEDRCDARGLMEAQAALGDAESSDAPPRAVMERWWRNFERARPRRRVRIGSKFCCIRL